MIFSYSISIISQPSHQECLVENDVGIALGDVTDVLISCEWILYSVSGIVNNFNINSTLILQSGNTVVYVNGTNTFTFENMHDYSIIILEDPLSQNCEIENGDGIALGNVEDVKYHFYYFSLRSIETIMIFSKL